MPVEIDPVESAETPPEKADVVIIGGGIVGVSAALFLAEQGVRTALCEKGVIAGEQSSRNWGWCRAMGRDPRELPLMLESLGLWRGMNERIGAETGFRPCGTLYICPDEADLAKREAWLPFAREHGVDSRLLRGAEVNAVLDGAKTRWLGALHTPGDGVAEPSLAAPAIARAAQRLGATILQRCAVRGLDMAAGRVAGVVTETGRIAADRVLLAGGAWSSLLARQYGVRLPQLAVRASVLRTAPVAGGPSTAAWGPDLALRKRLDGGYTVSSGGLIAEIAPDSFRFFRDFLPALRMEWSGITLRLGLGFYREAMRGRPWRLDEASPFEETRILDPEPEAAHIAQARAALERAFPAFRGVETAARWAGVIDATPDFVPVISEVDAVPGLVIATGFSGHGFGIGPGAGRLAADLVAGRPPAVSATPFRLARFSGGERPRPVAGL